MEKQKISSDYWICVMESIKVIAEAMAHAKNSYAERELAINLSKLVAIMVDEQNKTNE